MTFAESLQVRQRSPELLGLLLMQLIGTEALGVRTSYGDELRLDFGKRVSPSGISGFEAVWTLSIRAARWRGESIHDDDSNAVAKLQEALIGGIVIDVAVLDGFGLQLRFSNGQSLSVEPDLSDEDVSAWELWTPFDFVVVAGPGRGWRIVDADAPFTVPSKDAEIPAPAKGNVEALLPWLKADAPADVLHGVGQALAAQGAFDQAAIFMRRALDRGLPSGELSLAYATVLAQSGHLQHAAVLSEQLRTQQERVLRTQHKLLRRQADHLQIRLLAFQATFEAQRNFDYAARLMIQAVELDKALESATAAHLLRHEIPRLAREMSDVFSEAASRVRAVIDSVLQNRSRR
jgi:hypothetical protein